jgi:hypothetical protein
MRGGGIRGAKFVGLVLVYRTWKMVEFTTPQPAFIAAANAIGSVESSFSSSSSSSFSEDSSSSAERR